MRLSLATISLLFAVMSKRAISPRMRSGTSSNSTASLAEVEGVEREELLEDLLGREAERFQQRRHRHLAAAVDAEVQVILRVVLEVEPRAAVGNHARREEQLAGRVRLAAVVLEEDARASGGAARR